MLVLDVLWISDEQGGAANGVFDVPAVVLLL